MEKFSARPPKKESMPPASPDRSVNRRTQRTPCCTYPERRILSIPSRLDTLRLRARRRRSRRRCRRREHVFVTFLFRALLDLDRAFEVGSVFDDDLRRRQISVHRTVLLDLDLALSTDVTIHASVHDHLVSDDVGRQLCCSSDRQLPLIEMDQTFNSSVNVQVLIPPDFPFHIQARPQPRSRAVRHRFRWTHRVSARIGYSLPERRSGLWQLIRLQVFRFRVRILRRIRFLVTPHWTSLGRSTACV